jgi:hypothetical protein
VVLLRGRQRVEVMALCESYNIDVSGKMVGLERSVYENETDSEVLRILVTGRSSWRAFL